MGGILCHVELGDGQTDSHPKFNFMAITHQIMQKDMLLYFDGWIDTYIINVIVHHRESC